MKALLAAGLLWVANACGQYVRFDAVAAGGPVVHYDEGLAEGTNFWCQLYVYRTWVAEPVGPKVNFQIGTNAGYPVALVDPIFVGDAPVTLSLRAWKGDANSTYDSSFRHGESLRWEYTNDFGTVEQPALFPSHLERMFIVYNPDFNWPRTPDMYPIQVSFVATPINGRRRLGYFDCTTGESTSFIIEGHFPAYTNHVYATFWAREATGPWELWDCYYSGWFWTTYNMTNAGFVFPVDTKSTNGQIRFMCVKALQIDPVPSPYTNSVLHWLYGNW